MSKFLSLFATLLLGVTWMVAQGDMSQTPGQSGQATTQSSQDTTQTSSDTGNQTTVQGCLSGSADNYTLTDTSGTTYQLTGNTSKLRKHVGHQVEITGTAAASGGQSSAGRSETGAAGNGANSQQQTLQVSSVKHLSTSCNSTH